MELFSDDRCSVTDQSQFFFFFLGSSSLYLPFARAIDVNWTQQGEQQPRVTPSVKVESPLFHIMPHNAIVEQHFQLAILFHQIVKKDKEKYSAFSPAFLSLQFAELLGYLLK